MDRTESRIRVTVVQPALAKYRIPVFRELAKRSGIDLQVVYGALKGLPNVEADGFCAKPSPLRRVEIAGRMAMFHRAQWTYATRRHSDVLVMHWSPRYLSAVPAILRARFHGVAVVLWGHGYSKTERKWWIRIRNWIAQLADAILFYEPRTRERFVEEGWNPEKLFFALNSIDPTEIEKSRRAWQAKPEQLESFRKENHLGKGPVVLFVSRLQRENRVDLLIQATLELVKTTPSLKVVIIGNGDEEKARLQKLVHALGLSENVLFVDGIYDEQKLAPWFLVSRVFCYPSNIGLSVIHAFWYGLPVVTSNDSARQNPEVVVIEDGVNSLLYEHGSAQSLAAALSRVFTEDELSDSMSRSAIRTVEETFTIKNMVDGFEAAVRFAHQAVVTKAEKKNSL